MSTTIEASQPTSYSTADAVKEWVSSLPTIYETQLKYAPQEAEMQVQLASDYAGQLGEAYKKAQEAMYPETSALQENLAKQATEGMKSGMPSWARSQYLDTMRSTTGTGGIGKDYVSRGLLEQNKNWQDYYRNLGLTVAGRQPLSQAQSPNYSNYMSSFTPTGVMNYLNNQYATNANIYGNQLQANSSNNILGSLIGSAGTMGAGFLMSSLKYKTNIKLWA